MFLAHGEVKYRIRELQGPGDNAPGFLAPLASQTDLSEGSSCLPHSEQEA